MTATEHRAGGLDANARGIAVLLVAVVIGFLLLLKAGPTSSADGQVAAGGPSTTIDVSGLGTDETTTTEAGSDTTTTTVPEGGDVRQPGDVTVLVLNGSSLTGVAGSNTETIKAAGYNTQEPGNAAANQATTSVYYAEGYQVEATAVAAVLGKAPDVVAPLPDTAPGPGADAANVVVVLGADTPAASSSGSSGSSASTTSTPAAG